MTEVDDVRARIENTYACVQTAPSIRTALGEAFGMRAGRHVEGKLVTALRELGFKKVFETDFGAEMRVMEESAELKKRIDNNDRLPMMTSCCPSWVGVCVKMYPDLIPNLSTCMSPMEMVSSLTKKFFEHRGKKRVSITGIMPCFAKKREAEKGVTDGVLTAMELANWMKEEGINLRDLEDGVYDSPFGGTSSAGTIYASTGGVSEATLRTFSALFGEACPPRHLYEERIIGDGIREEDVVCGKYELRVAMVEGINAVSRFCRDLLKGGNMDFDLVEMMFCHGGCVGGPGMPNAGNDDYISKRIGALRKYDDNSPIMRADEDPLVQGVYKKHLGKPFSAKSRRVLHVKDFNIFK